MDIENRLRRLERTNRLLWLALVAGVAGLFVSAASEPHGGNITANSIRTRSLYVTNPYGKQGVQIEVGDTGMVALALTDPHGKQTLTLGTEPSGTPSICVSTGGPCRVILGAVDRGKTSEMSLQLRDANGQVVWMPQVRNGVRSSLR